MGILSLLANVIFMVLCMEAMVDLDAGKYELEDLRSGDSELSPLER